MTIGTKARERESARERAPERESARERAPERERERARDRETEPGRGGQGCQRREHKVEWLGILNRPSTTGTNWRATYSLELHAHQGQGEAVAESAVTSLVGEQVLAAAVVDHVASAARQQRLLLHTVTDLTMPREHDHLSLNLQHYGLILTGKSGTLKKRHSRDVDHEPHREEGS